MQFWQLPFFFNVSFFPQLLTCLIIFLLKFTNVVQGSRYWGKQAFSMRNYVNLARSWTVFGVCWNYWHVCLWFPLVNYVFIFPFGLGFMREPLSIFPALIQNHFYWRFLSTWIGSSGWLFSCLFINFWFWDCIVCLCLKNISFINVSVLPPGVELFAPCPLTSSTATVFLVSVWKHLPSRLMLLFLSFIFLRGNRG